MNSKSYNNLEELERSDVECTAKIALEIGVFDVLPIYNFKNFHAIKSGIKFNIPTNKFKSNRCSIFCKEEDLYLIKLTSEYVDKRRSHLVENSKLEKEFDSLENLSCFIFDELVKFNQ